MASGGIVPIEGGGGESGRLAERAARARMEGLAERARAAAGEKDAGEAAQGFESLLATMLVKEMRRALPEGFFGAGSGADVFDGWLDEHLGQALAASGALDLAGSIRISLGEKAAALAQSQAAGGER